MVSHRSSYEMARTLHLGRKRTNPKSQTRLAGLPYMRECDTDIEINSGLRMLVLFPSFGELQLSLS